MPELPEVETIRRELESQIISHPIKRVKVLAGKSVYGRAGEFVKQLTGNSITKIDRRGKLLILDLKKGGQKLLVHLKMTGQLVYKYGKELTFGGHNIAESDLVVPNRFTRIVLYFQPKAGQPWAGALYFNDMRRFGFMKLVDEKDLATVVNKSYGVDALSANFTAKYLVAALARRGNTTIKAVLLDQKHLAGIGNIYADEICFAVGIRPDRRVKTLKPAKILEIYKAIKQVLNLAIKHGGTTFTSKILAGHFVRSNGAKGNFTEHLKVFDRTRERCLRCKKGIIQKTRVAGRGTHFCPKCQR